MFFQPALCMLHKYLAVYIRMQGMYDVPVQCRSHCSPLLSSIEETRKYFRELNPNDYPCNTKAMGKLFSHFLISHEFYENPLVSNVCAISGLQRVRTISSFTLQDIHVILSLSHPSPHESAFGCTSLLPSYPMTFPY